MKYSLRSGIGLRRLYDPDYPGERNPWDSQKHPDHYQYIQNLIEKIDADPCRPPKYSDETKLEVFRLRDEGKTLRQIAEKVKVSKSTACLYLQNRVALEASIQNSRSIKVMQPGTDKVIETNYTLQKVNVGKIKTSKLSKTS